MILSRFTEPFLKFIAVCSSAVLLVSAAALVTVQYQVRLLFIEIERAHDDARKLSDDASQLELDLSKASLPAAVEEKATALGFSPARVNNTVILEVDPAELKPGALKLRFADEAH